MDEIDYNNMSFSDLPLVIDMTLYKNNYYDNCNDNLNINRQH